MPPTHLARFVVDILQQLDFSSIYARYGKKGGMAIAPEILFGLLVYGYATGVFSSRKIERATYESLPFRFVAGGHHPNHDTLAHFRKTFLPEIQGLFVQVLLLAEMTGHLQLGNLSLDGSKIHADASKSQAVSHKRLLAMEKQLQEEVARLFQLAQALDQSEGALRADVNLAVAGLTERIDHPIKRSGTKVPQGRAFTSEKEFSPQRHKGHGEEARGFLGVPCASAVKPE